MFFKNLIFLAGYFLCISLNLVFGQPGGLSDKEVYFESKIRPIFAEHCIKCHGEEKQKGGLRMDSIHFIIKGGDSGPALVKGDHKSSLITRALHWEEDLEMPPKEQLKKDQIIFIEKWIDMGAPWPITEESKTVAIDPFDEILKKAKHHWAFQSIQKVHVNLNQDDKWVQNEIDHFILNKLHSAQIKPSKPADEVTLLRRIYLSMVGMPPSIKEARKFLENKKGNQKEKISKLIEKLLNDSRYGERWGRHWLDVVRYGDSKGPIFGEVAEYPYAYTYRDYVIDSFNKDKPYNQFLTEQIAADLITKDKQDPSLAALGFLTVHRRTFMAKDEEPWIDRVDTVSRAMLGLTVVCARCHDHKYDPISIKDFYSLMGVFASIEEPKELPIIGGLAENSPIKHQFNHFSDTINKEIQDYINETYKKILEENRNRIPEYLLACYENKSDHENTLRTLAGERKLNPDILIRWHDLLNGNDFHNIWMPWRRLKQNEPIEYKLLEKNKLNPILLKVLKTHQPKTMSDLIEVYTTLFKSLQHETTPYESHDQKELQQFIYGKNAPGVLPAGDFSMLNTKAFNTLVRKNSERAIKLSIHPGAPKRAMVVQEKDEPYHPHVFIRGNSDRPGESVPRQFLTILSDGKPKPYNNNSGRLELAKAIANPTNPLTARVLVNRIWMQHFGKGLVTTPSDFGLRSNHPSHPELLDWLAKDFIENGWSIKRLHRLILNSSTYQQSSDFNEHKYSKDPDNQFLWRFTQRRLEFEAIYDSMLSVSGKLDPKKGGPPVLLKVVAGKKKSAATWNVNPYRRAVYGAVDRIALPAMMTTFDFPNPDESSAQRSITTVPTQSLFMLNSPFIMDMAKSLISRPYIQNAIHPEEKIKRLYQMSYNREPSLKELEAGLNFTSEFYEIKQQTTTSSKTKILKASLRETQLKSSDDQKELNAWERYAQVLLMSNHFIFLK